MGEISNPFAIAVRFSGTYRQYHTPTVEIVSVGHKEPILFNLPIALDIKARSTAV